MRDFSEKISAIPGFYFFFNLCKTLVFMLCACLIVLAGGAVGWGAGWLLASLFAAGFNANRDVVLSVVPLVSGAGGLILAAYFLIPKLLDRFDGRK